MAAIAAIALAGCNGTDGTNTSIDGVDGPNVSVSNGYVMMNFVFKNVNIDGGATIPVPNFDGSSIYVGPDFSSGGLLLQVSVRAVDFFDGQNLDLDPQFLPGGRPLPTVGGGSLPSVAVTVPQLHDTVFYIGKDVLGFFVPYDGIKLDGAIISSNFYDTAKKKVGTLSVVGADEHGENSGILLLLSTSLLGIDQFRPTMQ
jgi:hypothetical protein